MTNVRWRWINKEEGDRLEEDDRLVVELGEALNILMEAGGTPPKVVKILKNAVELLLDRRYS